MFTSSIAVAETPTVADYKSKTAQEIDVILRNSSFCSLIVPVDIEQTKSSSLGEIPDRVQKGHKN